MKRWRTDGFAQRCLVAAALALPWFRRGVARHGRIASAESPRAAAPTSRPRNSTASATTSATRSRPAKFPAPILLIQQHGKPVYFENFGVRDVATQLPMTADTIFRLYSMSKPVTSVAAMMLVDDGKLSLDDPVAKYIPAFAEVKVGCREAGRKPGAGLEPLNRPITIKDLLRHTSGLTYGFYGDSSVRKLYAQANLFDGDIDNAEFVDADCKTAAGRTAGNAVGLRPFDRRARPRHRGGVGEIAVSVREGAAVRSARHDRNRVLTSPTPRSGRASPSRCRPTASSRRSPGSGIP